MNRKAGTLDPGLAALIELSSTSHGSGRRYLTLIRVGTFGGGISAGISNASRMHPQAPSVSKYAYATVVVGPKPRPLLAAGFDEYLIALPHAYKAHNLRARGRRLVGDRRGQNATADRSGQEEQQGDEQGRDEPAQGPGSGPSRGPPF